MKTKGIVIVIYLMLIHCSDIQCSTVTCDFEMDECGWTLDSIWTIYPSGSTPETASSGPTSDHTTGNGSYVRFFASLLSESNQFGIMNTSVFLNTSTDFTFWYFMHGTRIGTLALVINNQTVWEKSGRQGIPAWYQANINLTDMEDLQIAFVASRAGLGRSSDIAIDDIVLQGEPMPMSTRTTRTRPTTTPRTRFNASCDFDVNTELCGWKSDTRDGWKVIHERETNITIGPSSDYSSITRLSNDGKICKIPYEETSNQYYYCVLNKNNMQCKGNDNKWFNCRDGGFVQIRTNEFDDVGERSQFDSPILDALSDEGCIQFQYNIAGNDNDWLNVYVEDYWSGNQSCVWHMNGSSVPDRWMAGEVSVQIERGGKYKITFEAGKGKAGGLGLVSLDHIVVSSIPCFGKYTVTEFYSPETTINTDDTEVSQATTGLDIVSSSKTTIEVIVTLTPTIMTATTSSYNQEHDRPTTVISSSKNSSTVSIIVGIVGSVAVVSAVLALFIFRKPLLSRLGVKRSNRVALTPTYKSTPEGSVEINMGTKDRTHLL